ncbi:MAG: diguanylate cyclase domain-containing protein, partial [Actinomycetes bacterium]
MAAVVADGVASAAHDAPAAHDAAPADGGAGGANGVRESRPPTPEPRETSSATTRLVLAYVRTRGGQRLVDDLLTRAGLADRTDLEQEGTWVGYDTRNRLFEAATDLLGPGTMRAIGASAAHAGVSHSLILLLRAIGSPAMVYRQLPRQVGRFTTTSSMRVIESGRTRALLQYTLHDGYEHSRLDCEYAQGLISAVPEIFGLPAARVEHDLCQHDGHPACMYDVTWSAWQRWSSRRRARDLEVDSLRGQLRELQSAAADLVSDGDPQSVLERIVQRAAAAVLAPAHLLAVNSLAITSHAEPLIVANGVVPADVAPLAARLLAGEDLGPNAVCVDVMSGRRRHGRLAALYAEGHVASPDEVDLLAAYAGHAAAALDLVFALEESRRGERRATALLAFSHELAQRDDVHEITRVLADALPEVVGATIASVYLWDPATGRLDAVAESGHGDLAPHVLATSLVPADTPELAEMLARRQPTELRPGRISAALQALFDQIGISHALTVPLVAGDELMGVAAVGWTEWPGRERRGEPSDEDLLLRLLSMADQAATALHKARLLEDVRHRSLHDALTGLPNRVLFGRRLEQALRACQDEREVAVLFCDLDGFKGVNDRYGHAAGDDLLREVAQRLRATVGDDDLVARLSGDEFAVVLADSRGEAEDVAQAIVLAVEEPFRLEGAVIRLTASVGIAAHRGPGGRGESLLQASDAAMYQAKTHGRNRTWTMSAQRALPGITRVATELATAVAEQQFALHYQPVLRYTYRASGDSRDLRPSSSAVVIGAEALIRWQHPRLGLLTPGAFLNAAEESGV